MVSALVLNEKISDVETITHDTLHPFGFLQRPVGLGSLGCPPSCPRLPSGEAARNRLGSYRARSNPRGPHSCVVQSSELTRGPLANRRNAGSEGQKRRVEGPVTFVRAGKLPHGRAPCKARSDSKRPSRSVTHALRGALARPPAGQGVPGALGNWPSNFLRSGIPVAHEASLDPPCSPSSPSPAAASST